MSTPFENLCNELHVTQADKNEASLNVLAQWCFEQISRDIRFTGALENQYQQYIQLAKNYVDGFLPYIVQDIASPITQFNNLNAIQQAAQCGYDHFISHQPTIPAAVIDMKNQYGMTPLHTSATRGYRFTVEALLKHGANAQLVNQQQQTPLVSALFIPIAHDQSLVLNKETIYRMLVQQIPQTLLGQDISGDTILHKIIASGFNSLLQEAIDQAPSLVFIANNLSHYPIHTAILNNRVAMLDILLSIEGVANLTDGKHRNALHYASLNGAPTVIQLVAKYSEDINSRDRENKTPLLLAAEVGNLEAIKTLLQLHADALATDSMGLNMLHCAKNNHHNELVTWLLTYGPEGI